MNRHRIRITIIALILFIFGMACACNNSTINAEPDPLATIQRLLELHGLKGKHPEDRDEQGKKREIDRKSLAKLIADLDPKDVFVTDIYIGFIVGSLAKNQNNLFVNRLGKTVEVSAGRTKVILNLKDNAWKINLAESIPAEFKQRAAEEKKSYQAAKERAAQTH